MRINKRRFFTLILIISVLSMSVFVGCKKDSGDQGTTPTPDQATGGPTTGPADEPGTTDEPGATDEPEATEEPDHSDISIPDVSVDDFEIPASPAQAFVDDMKIGWNLGNTLDAIDCTWLDNKLDYESGWSGIKTTEEMIIAVKDAGFNTVRIPVSWHNHVSGDDYDIDEPWLNRVGEVVDYAIDNGLIAIINIHHDMSEEFIFPTSESMDQSSHYVKRIWTQLAEKFKDYDEKLVFESMNEPRMIGTEHEWWLDPNNDACKDAVASINRLNQTFVDTVRASGGNNSDRYLMVPGYAASVAGVLDKGFGLPSDTQEYKLILSVHAYTPYNFALEAGGVSSFSVDNSSSVREIDQFMTQLYREFVYQGVPVVLGEFGARDKNGNTQDRVNFATYYVAAARARGMTCIWWDNHAFTGDGELFGILDRASSTWKYPEIVEGLMKYAR
ncbi:MAG TPA: glycoside hydrolase family 5 protein [Bacillota bacterium]|nr:glycoside hydrolase family 5 protein [Bacillota bacterium]